MAGVNAAGHGFSDLTLDGVKIEVDYFTFNGQFIVHAVWSGHGWIDASDFKPEFAARMNKQLTAEFAAEMAQRRAA